jgi:hypothetical protein
MATNPTIAAALASSHEALNNANKFSSSVNKQAGIKSKPQPKSDYGMARASRPNAPAPKPPTVGDELDSKAANVDNYKTNTPSQQ